MLTRPSPRRRRTRRPTASSGSLCSLWLIRLPAAPAAPTDSGGTNPVVLEGSTSSTCWARTGIETERATCIRDVCGGATIIARPTLPEARSAERAKRRAPSPCASG
jgi:hypothetical protein